MTLLSLDRRIDKAVDPTVGELVTKYGTNINRLTQDVAAGKVDPTKALMVKMTIQRIISANTQPQAESTVAQDYGMAYGGQVAVSNNQIPAPAMERGLTGIPIPDNMFDYAEGGIVAFGDGGDVKRFQAAGAVNLPYSATSSVGINPVFPSGGSGLSYGYGMNPTGANSVRIPSTFDYRIAPPAPPGTPAILQNPLSRVNPTGFKQFVEQVSKLAPYLDEVALEKLYQQTAGNVSKAINFLKNLGPTAVLGAASLGVEQATGLSSSDQLLAGIQAGNPALSIVSRMMGIQPTPAKKEKDTKDEKGLTSIAEFYRNASPEMKKYLDQFGRGNREQIPTYGMTPGLPNLKALDAAVEAAKKGKPTEASAATPPAATSTAPRQEERRGSSTSSGLSSTVPSVGSGQTGDFTVSPEKRARTLVDESGLPKVEPLTDEQALQRIKDIEAKSGVDPDFFKKIQGRIDTMREEAKTDKKEAANLRIIEAGLGILGGTSPYAFVNIGKGASEAVKSFGQDLKEYQKARRELDKAEMDLQSAEQNAARTKSSTAINLVERRQDQVNAAKTKEAEFYTSGVKAFADLGEQAKGRVSRENIAMAQLQASRDETIARIAQSDRQIAESATARRESARILADQRFLDGLNKAVKAVTDTYDTQIETIQKALSNPAAAITPDFVKQQKDEINNLIRQRTAAGKLAEQRYMAMYRSGRPTQDDASLSAADRITGIRR